MDNPDSPKTELRLALFQQQQELLKTCVEALGSMARSVESLLTNHDVSQQSIQDIGKAQAELEGRVLRLEAEVRGNGHGATAVE